MLNIGEAWTHKERYRETMLNKTASVPSLSILVKDHKQVGQGELPKSRPVCSSGESMNLHLNNIVSEILEPLANITGTSEVISSEEGVE